MKTHYAVMNYQWTKLIVLVLVAIQMHEASLFFTSLYVPSKEKTFGERVIEDNTLRCQQKKWRCVR